MTDVYAEANPLMVWRGARTAAPRDPAAPEASLPGFSLASHKVIVDNGLMIDGAFDLRRSARKSVAFVSPRSLEALGLSEDDLVDIEGPRGRITLPIETGDLPDEVVWVPECSIGRGINCDLAPAGSDVQITAAREVAL